MAVMRAVSRGLIAIMNREYLNEMVTTSDGQVLLALSGVLLLIGGAWMKRLARAGGEAKEALQRAVDWMFPMTLEWFGLPPGSDSGPPLADTKRGTKIDRLTAYCRSAKSLKSEKFSACRLHFVRRVPNQARRRRPGKLGSLPCA